eukprot:scaffold13169_cov32-Phaeocystis_antarctica.AAC.3
MAVQRALRPQKGASSTAHVTSTRHAHHHPHPPRAHATHSACFRALGVSRATNLKSNCCRGGPAPCEDVERDARAADNPRRAVPNAVLHVPRTSRAEARVECTR